MIVAHKFGLVSVYCQTKDSVDSSDWKPKDLHCWADGPDDDGIGSTCFLLADHEGPHEWTRDDRITVQILAEGGK